MKAIALLVHVAVAASVAVSVTADTSSGRPEWLRTTNEHQTTTTNNKKIKNNTGTNHKFRIPISSHSNLLHPLNQNQNNNTCDIETEEACTNTDTGDITCIKYAEGGCPCPNANETKCGATGNYPGYCTPICCDWETEETCDDDSTPVPYCARYDVGGCPCPDDQIKCGASEHSAGYCTNVCCDWETEETCYDTKLNPTQCIKYSDGGCPCPKMQVKCAFSESDPGYCAKVCCDETVEETCLDGNGVPESCAAFAEGGCPCEEEGDEKCGYNDLFPGYCTKVCCNDEIEETCYDVNWSPLSCAKIEEGGCPCPEGEVKCGVSETYAGYCTAVCCDYDTEEMCYSDDGTYTPDSCAKIADGGCPCPTGEMKCGGSENYAGYCTDDPCCDEETEEVCYSDDNAMSCASIADGGCPCPDDQEKCGEYCMDVCCDLNIEETCWDDNWNKYCVAIADGGCPCPEGEEKCGRNANYAGYCTSLCCDWRTEQTCYDEEWNTQFCAPYEEGCPANHVSDGAHKAAFTQATEMTKRAAEYHDAKVFERNLLAERIGSDHAIKRLVQAAELADFRILMQRVKSYHALYKIEE